MQVLNKQILLFIIIITYHINFNFFIKYFIIMGFNSSTIINYTAIINFKFKE